MSPELTTVLMLLSLFILLQAFRSRSYRHHGPALRISDRRQRLPLHAAPARHQRHASEYILAASRFSSSWEP